MSTLAYTQMPGFLPGASYQPPRSSPATEQAQPRLAYFITRHNGQAVPLIPADELPFTVKLQNVSRVLQPQDTSGMQFVGTSPYTGTTFKLDAGPASAAMQCSNNQPPNDPSYAHRQGGMGTRKFLAPDAMSRQVYASNASITTNDPAMSPLRPVSASETAKSWRRSDPVESSDAIQAAIDAILRTEAGAETAERSGYRSRNATPPPSGIMPDQDKKVFCTHWIMTGDCKYVQQGCRYKHEMPTEAGLKEIGIRNTPRWWQEQNAAIKLGGARNVRGPVMKPMEMLSIMSKDEETDDESSSDEEADPESEKELPKVQARRTSPVKEAIVGSKRILKPETKSPVEVEAPRRPSPSVGNIGKPSDAPCDLIDFPSLQPTPVTSTATASSNNVTQKSTSSAIESLPDTPATKTSKVFVPAGESPEAHIAEMKKRERPTRHVHHSRTPSPSHLDGSASSSNTSVKATGLLASKHAPTSAENSPKRNRAGCRIRRPATSSPGGVAEKKEKN